MKAKIEVELQPFTVPDCVSVAGRQGDNGKQALVSCPLGALDPYTLDNLCSASRREVFRKAGKELPPGIREG